MINSLSAKNHGHVSLTHTHTITHELHRPAIHDHYSDSSNTNIETRFGRHLTVYLMFLKNGQQL